MVLKSPEPLGEVGGVGIHAVHGRVQADAQDAYTDQARGDNTHDDPPAAPTRLGRGLGGWGALGAHDAVLGDAVGPTSSVGVPELMSAGRIREPARRGGLWLWLP